jgi:hypothetical protein
LRLALLGAFALAQAAAANPPVGQCPVVAERGGWRIPDLRSFPARAGLLKSQAPAALPTDNLIDREVSRKLAENKVEPAALTSDAEFLRRATLDLTGQIPRPDAIRAFLADTSAGKRMRLVDQLLSSPAATDRWTFWLTTWLQYQDGFLRDQYGLFQYLRDFVGKDRPIPDLVQEIVGAGNSVNFTEYERGTFLSSMFTTGGPPSDTADNMLVKTATVFLGMSHYDCLLCHGGRGRLDQVSAWGRRVTRREANEMAAFFARTNAVRVGFDIYNIQLNEFSGGYPANTTWGNRPKREAMPGSPDVIAPRYRLAEQEDTATSGVTLRRSLADQLVADPMFARNVVNRLWREMFGAGLAEPFDTLDPARLDPSQPPPEGWTYQASHPELLEELAKAFIADGYRIRPLIRRIAASTTYQLSHRYGPDWRSENLPLMARHLPRRLQAEEIHDAIRQGLGLTEPYDVPLLGKLSRAMQFPEVAEPRLYPNAVRFLQSLGRTERGPVTRKLTGGIPMSLALAADSFVLDQVRVAKAPELQRVSRLSTPAAMIEELYLLFLSRLPSTEEQRVAEEGFARAGSTEAAIEDLAWALINSGSFVFSE